jgi:hypothetical protein
MSNAVLLLPAYGLIHRPHIDSLVACKADTIFLDNAACIDQARNLLVEKGLQTDKDVFVFVDSDISFLPADLDLLVKNCNDTQEIVGGLYVSKKGNNKVVMTVLPDGKTQTTRGDGLLPVYGVGMGFTAIHRQAFRKIASTMDRVKLPTGEDFEDIYPFFLPIIEQGYYLGEDYSFCVKAHKAGVNVHFNHLIQVSHWGMRPHRFES